MSSKPKQIYRPIPNGIPQYKSKLAKDSTNFLWEIDDVFQVKEQGAWEAINVSFKVRDFSWRLSLTADGKYLYVKPALIEPKNAAVKFILDIRVLNDKNFVMYTPIYGGSSGYIGCTTEPEHKWEVLKFGETNFDYFSSMVYNGNLKLFVEMTVLYDTHGQGSKN